MNKKNLGVLEAIEQELVPPRVKGRQGRVTIVSETLDVVPSQPEVEGEKKEDDSKYMDRSDSLHKIYSKQQKKDAIIRENGNPRQIHFPSVTLSPRLERLAAGMTWQECLITAGKPDETICWYQGHMRCRYGNVWVVFENNKISCMVHASGFHRFWGRGKYTRLLPEALVK